MPLCQLEDWNSLILTGGGLLDEDADARANEGDATNRSRRLGDPLVAGPINTYRRYPRRGRAL
jgi:hypothetical protein